jgi:hypothetical protein
VKIISSLVARSPAPLSFFRANRVERFDVRHSDILSGRSLNRCVITTTATHNRRRFYALCTGL